MATNFKDISEKVFNLLKGHGFDLRTFNKEGKVVIDPQEGTRFVSDEPNILVRVDDMEKEISLQTSEDFADHNLRNLLKELAQDSLLSFDFRVFDKKIEPKGEEIDVARRQEIDMNEEINLLKRLSGIEENTKDPEPKGEVCMDCEGTGYDGDKSCSICDGEGIDDGYFGGTKAYEEEQINEVAPLAYGAWLIGTRIVAGVARYALRNPAKTFIATDALDGELDQTKEALDWVEDNVLPEVTPDAWEPIIDAIQKYALPVSAVALAVYGGVKLKKYLNKLKKKAEEEQMQMQTEDSDIRRPAYSLNEVKMIKTRVGEMPVNADGSALSFSDYYNWEMKTSKDKPKPNIISQRYGIYKADHEQFAEGKNDPTVPYSKSVEKDLADRMADKIDPKYLDQEAMRGRPKGKKESPYDRYMRHMKPVRKAQKKESVTEASLGRMTGSRKSSYQPLADNVKIIVRHNKEVNEEVRGARSRNIHSILIQRGEEKFKMAENNLSAARAMARHLHNGGETFDEIGESITEMSREFKKLKEFIQYVRKANLVNEANEEFVTMAMENINDIKTNLKRLSGVKTYANAVETVMSYNNVEILQDDLDLESKFTETHFDEKVSNVMDSLKAMTSRKQSFENKIVKAIESETFANVKDLLSENDIVDFDTPHGKLGHQVSQLGYSASDNTLSNYLHGISSKISAGGQLNQFEYGTIKSCLLSAGQHNVKTAPVDVEESYEAFIDQFVE